MAYGMITMMVAVLSVAVDARANLENPFNSLQHLGLPSLPTLPQFNLGLLSPTQAPAVGPTGEEIPCTCGVFLSGQFKRGSPEPPRGNAALLQELMEHPMHCGQAAERQCTNRCLETMVKHLSNSPALVCGGIDRDTFKERAYLFIKNCKDQWVNTQMSAGREYCCKNGEPYKCPSNM